MDHDLGHTPASMDHIINVLRGPVDCVGSVALR